MSKKLLILLLDDTILEQFLSWPKRELGAVVEFYAGGNAMEPPTATIKAHVERHQPDVVLIDSSAGGPKMIPIPCAKWIKDRCRAVHCCFDATDPPWHRYLAMFKEADCFDLCIAADGATDWPHKPTDLSLPTPVDPAYYEDWDKHERNVELGFSGSIGHDTPRQNTLKQLQGLVTVQRRDHVRHPYSRNADFYKRCWAAVNDANTTWKRLHMKARAVEAALAGCLLFETKGSPTSRWLTPYNFGSLGEYIEYENTDQVRATCANPEFHEMCKVVGQRARAKMLQHGPAEFWSAVMGGSTNDRSVLPPL